MISYSSIYTYIYLNKHSRVRVLPPLDERVYRGLLRVAAVALDPFPVGMHLPILEAFAVGTPVVSIYGFVCIMLMYMFR